MSPPPVTVLVPVKPPARGKSRLSGMTAERRSALAEGFALDTIAAALETPVVEQVLVVTDDASFAARCGELGVTAVPDGASDLNLSLRQASAEAVRRWPGHLHLVLCADLPTLRPTMLAAMLTAAGRGPAFVPDRASVGTTCYLATPESFAPSFGTGSAQAHRAGGASEVTVGRSRDGGAVDLAPLRHDVDDADDLARAVSLGVGPFTTAALLG